MGELIRSPLHDRHQALGARFAEFGGWEMPLQYSSTIAEHRQVRSGVGIFDVSHLGTVMVAGPAAIDFLNSCLSNDLNRIGDGQAQYTLACQGDGGVVDDLIVYRFGSERALLVPNAANAATVVELLTEAAPEGILITDEHTDHAIIAVQGPASAEVLDALGLPSRQDYMGFAEGFWQGPVIVCRTGYTGERGYELIVAAEAAGRLWDALLAAGAEYDILPCGLAARDTLRTEMGYALHGHELTSAITPLQAGVGWAVGWTKPAFWGAEALRAERAAGPRLRSRGLRALGRAIPRAGMAVEDSEGRHLGVLTSGTFSPTLSVGIGLALLESSVGIGEEVTVVVRERREPFEVVVPPFVEASVR